MSLPLVGWPDFASIKLRTIARLAAVVKWHYGTGILLKIESKLHNSRSLA